MKNNTYSTTNPKLNYTTSTNNSNLTTAGSTMISGSFFSNWENILEYISITTKEKTCDYCGKKVYQSIILSKNKEKEDRIICSACIIKALDKVLGIKIAVANKI